MSDDPSHDPDEEAIRRRRAELAQRVAPSHGPLPTPTACLSMPATCLSPPHRYGPHGAPQPCLSPSPSYDEIAKRPPSLVRSVIVAFVVGLAVSAVALFVIWLATR